VHRAPTLANTRAQTIHLDLIALRLGLRLGRWSDARALADSILADPDSAATGDQPTLQSVALLVGRPSVALRLGVRTADREGVTCGLDPQGFLRLRDDSGLETIVLAGGVRPI